MKIKFGLRAEFRKEFEKLGGKLIFIVTITICRFLML